jgi:hypothetical protein
VDQVKQIDQADNPATFKQSRALNRIIFGRHYSTETFTELMKVLN